ncbi:hypothetical protein [Streptomyces sp. KL116D]|uniref:hypothetical protein n=1 Tax=Streptomyces sp. KL116D TaxID=3045152 RepID=UPI0035573673
MPGLRREEGSARSRGVSVDYYIRLERRGDPSPDAVLDAVARVLRLDDSEAAYLLLGGPASADPAQAPARPQTAGAARPQAAR